MVYFILLNTAAASLFIFILRFQIARHSKITIAVNSNAETNSTNKLWFANGNPDTHLLAKTNSTIYFVLAIYYDLFIIIFIIFRSLDIPKSSEQKIAKQKLISTHKLRFANENPDTHLLAKTDWTLYFIFAGIIGALILGMSILVIIWCSQNAGYRRKLKAATTLAFGQFTFKFFYIFNKKYAYFDIFFKYGKLFFGPEGVLKNPGT